jgi:DNA invertase Pin-like site-specific DNA recombinase
MVLAMTQRAVLYGRVSQDRSEGKSVDDQLAECRAWAHRESWRIVAEHRDDGISASRYANGKARPGWQSVTDLITSGGVDLLVSYDM